MRPPPNAHTNTELLEAGLAQVRLAPATEGTLARIVARPSEGERVDLARGELSLDRGLVGDNWIERGSSRTDDGTSHPDMQLNLTNIRFLQLIAPDPADQLLVGDQLHVDLDLSEENVPPGTQLQIGEAVIEVTDQPHLGCAKYRRRFGPDALRFVNSPLGRELHLRGVNARVLEPGTIRAGDTITKRS